MRGHVRRAALVSVGLAVLGAAGCSLPEGVDGDLTNGWVAMSEPVGFVPDAGTCHRNAYQETGALAEYEPVDCDEEHVSEIVHVGEFTDGDDRETPPPSGSSQWREAFAECEEAAADYLGADFRFARLWLGVVVPSAPAWDGGARWFRCDVLEFEESIQFDRTRSGSLAGGLAEDSGSDLRLGCFTVELTEDERIDSMDSVACDEPHHAEFVGVWRAPADVPFLDGADQDSADRVHAGCREQVAEYVDVPVDGDLQFRTGTIADWMDEQDWDNGDRGFRCYLWLSGEEITESLADGGTDALPVN